MGEMTGRFDNQTALVTGSTQGLGEAVADALVAEGLAGLLVTGRNRERGRAVAERMSAAGCETRFVAADLADPDAAGRLIEAADETFGRLDVLVNAAAKTDRGTIHDTSRELFDEIMAVNVRSPLFLMQGAIRIMIREGIEGSIVNVGSMVAYCGPPYLTAYSASKGALMNLTGNVANAVRWDRIRVNALNIGWMDTPGEDVIRRKYHDGGDDWLQRAEAEQPFGRLLKPDEVARAVAFLASGESGMMTGAAVPFNQTVPGAVN